MPGLVTQSDPPGPSILFSISSSTRSLFSQTCWRKKSSFGILQEVSQASQEPTEAGNQQVSQSTRPQVHLALAKALVFRHIFLPLNSFQFLNCFRCNADIHTPREKLFPFLLPEPSCHWSHNPPSFKSHWRSHFLAFLSCQLQSKLQPLHFCNHSIGPPN